MARNKDSMPQPSSLTDAMAMAAGRMYAPEQEKPAASRAKPARKSGKAAAKRKPAAKAKAKAK